MGDTGGIGRICGGLNAVKLANAGIRTKLQLAFGSVALMTVVATGLAIMGFRSAEHRVERIAEREVPLMTEALRLSVMSGEISAAAARFVSASNVRDQRQIAAQIEDRSLQLRHLIERVRAGSSKEAFGAVEVASRLLESNLSDLDVVILSRSNLRSTLDRRLDALHTVHTRIAEELTPIVDKSYFDAVTKAEDIGKTGDRTVKTLVDDGMQMMQTVVQIGTETNLVTGLLTAGALTSSPAILAMLEDRFTASARRAEKQLARLPNDVRYDTLRERAAGLLKLAEFRKVAAGDNETARLQNVFRAHEGLANVLITLIDDLNFDAVMEGEQAVKRTGRLVKDLVNRQLANFRSVLELKIQTHLIASLLSEAAVARQSADLQPILDRFQTSAQLLLQAAQGVPDPQIREHLDALLELGRGDDNIFTLRGQELNVTAGANRVIDENLTIQKQLDQAVSALVRETESGMKDGTAVLLTELAHSRMLLVAVALVSLLIAGTIGFFYVQRSLVRRLSATGETMRRLSAGENDVAIAGNHDGDEIGEMARALTVFRDAAVAKERLEAQAVRDREAAEVERARNDATRAEAARQVAQVVDGLGRGLERLAGGDLTYRVRDDWAGEYRKVQDDFNNAIDQLQETLTAIVESTREVSSASAEISSSTTDLSQRTEEQAANLEETSASMEQISATVRKNAENARHANGLMRGTRDVAGRGGEVVSQAVSAMTRIEDCSRRIADILSVIDEIARQTNLLALNAAVEAARAGDAGRGFAVVASEVRNLAQRSSQAAKDIKDLITSSSSAIGQGVQLVNRAGESLKDILKSINEVAEIVADIASASAEQATGIEQINRALSQMDEVTQQNSALVEENAATAKTLEHQSHALDGRVAAFRLYEQEAPAAAPPAKVTPLQQRAGPTVRKPVRGSARQMQAALATAVAGDEWEAF
ncbi:methyl-accepting chemotaxis protein [Pseudorhodoplanes sp.]|uniref:methyl-accepting chemotaxis protein n=1 Tax=Pseudorhodoplanes sp. TaxID=1934341 RepID=UPI003D132DBD